MFASIFCAVLVAQSQDFTDEQILQMGRSRWFEVYTQENGDSTAGMSQAEWTWAAVVGRKNDRAIARLPKAKGQGWITFRKDLRTFGDHALDLEYYSSGGGTIFNIFGSSRAASTEDLIDQLLRNAVPASKPITPSKVQDQLKKFLKANAQGGFTEDHRAEIRRLSALLPKSLDRVLNFAKRRPAAQSRGILNFVNDCLDDERF